MQDELGLKLTVRIYKGEKAFGPGMLTLLTLIEKTGSLHKACESMDMAYSKAWKMIKETERLWGFALTVGDAGGKNGGGSRLTPEGRLLTEQYGQFMEEVKEKAELTFNKYFSEEFLSKLDKAGKAQKGSGN
ncbi:MAG: LysR family transcriptional regulator [Bacillota bacterium]|nr:LysR family transcriptional regulator [Bacillota bacterium]